VAATSSNSLLGGSRSGTQPPRIAIQRICTLDSRAGQYCQRSEIWAAIYEQTKNYKSHNLTITICAPLNYTAPCVMLLMPQMALAYRLDAISQRQKLSISRAQPHPTCPSKRCCPHQKHYARGRINHRCIGGFMYKRPPWRGLRVHTSIIPYVCIPAYLRVHTHMLARDRPRR
jgi:hypothetical protein